MNQLQTPPPAFPHDKPATSNQHCSVIMPGYMKLPRCHGNCQVSLRPWQSHNILLSRSNLTTKDGILPGWQGVRGETAEDKNLRQKKNRHAMTCLIKIVIDISIIPWHRGNHSFFCSRLLVFRPARGLAIPWQYRGTPGNAA